MISRSLRQSACAMLLAGLVLVLPGWTSASTTTPDPIYLSGDTAVGPAAGDQVDPVIERGGDQYLVVWVDHRTNLMNTEAGLEAGADIYAARLDGTGSLVDSFPIAISTDGTDQTDPRATWNGSVWLVTWRHLVPSGPSYQVQLRGVRIAPDGSILDPEPLVLHTFSNSGDYLIGIASDGEGWALFLTQTYVSGLSTRIRIIAQGVGTTGNPLGGIEYIFSPSCCFFFDGDVAFAGDEYLVVMEGMNTSAYTGIFGMRVAANLNVIDSYPFEIAIPPGDYPMLYQRPDVTTDGTDYWVSWVYRTSSTQSYIYGTRVTHDAVSLDGDGTDLSGPLGFEYPGFPLVTWDGVNWITGWEENGLRLSRVTPGGTILDPDGQYFPDLGAGGIAGEAGGGLKAVWPDDRAGGPRPLDIYTASFTSTLVAGPEDGISMGAPAQTLPCLADHGTGFMAVYQSEHSGARRILAQPLDAAGASLTGEPIEVASGVSVTLPALAWDGSRHLVTWTDLDDEMVYGRRMLADGTLLDPSPISIMPGEGTGVSALGGRFLVVGTDAPVNDNLRYPFAVRVEGSDGSVVDATPIQLGASFARAPRVTVFAGRWLVSWQRHPVHDDPVANIHAVLLHQDGSSSGDFVVAGDGAAAQVSPCVATGTGTGRALVAWEDYRNGSSNPDIYGCRIQLDGTLLDGSGIQITPVQKRQFRPDVAWNPAGSEYVLAFQDHRNTEYYSPFTFDLRSDCYATRLSSNGIPGTPDGFPLQNAPVPEIHPTLIEADGELLVAMGIFREDAPYMSYRIGLQFEPGDITGVSDVASEFREAKLYGPRPNPFNPFTTLRFALPRADHVFLAVYDVSGRRVATLADGHFEAGVFERSWNGRDERGRDVGTGVYFARIVTDGFSATQKMVLLK